MLRKALSSGVSRLVGSANGIAALAPAVAAAENGLAPKAISPALQFARTFAAAAEPAAAELSASDGKVTQARRDY